MKSFLGSLLLVLVWAVGSAFAGNFQTVSTYAMPATPGPIVLADFNHDGSLDIATSDGMSLVYIVLNNGDGSFKPPVGYAAGQDIFAIAVGDFNNDGNLDLVVTNRTPYGLAKPGAKGAASGCIYGCVTVLLGNGDGTFQPGVTYTAGSNAWSVAVADFNGDGKLDIVSSNNFDNNVSVLVGNGDGTFKTAVNYSVGTSPGFVVVGDFNGDHHPDIAVATDSSAGGVDVLLGNGDGTFQKAVSYPTGGINTYAVAVGDFNGDGKLDLAITNYNSGPSSTTSNFGVLLGNGDGTFQSARVQTYTAGITDQHVADVNGDGRADLIMATNAGFTVALGNGDGTFAPAVSYGGFYSCGVVAAGDLNGDNKLDIAASDFNSMAMVLGFGDGTFPAPRLYNPGISTAGVVAGDFNKDGFLDIAYSTGILLGMGDGTFTTGASYFAGSAVDGVAGDFNNDGFLDLAWANEIPKGSVFVPLGKGDGTFNKAASYSLGTTGKDPDSIGAADFNHDGNLDLVTANWDSNTVSVLLGNGDGTFKTAVNYAANDTPYGIAIGDFNGDGNLDFASVGSSVMLFLGNGDGTFQPQINIPSTGGLSVAAGDFNGDGKLDLVFAAYPNVSVVLGNGDGTFQSPITSPAGYDGHIRLADFNGDGILDIVAILFYTDFLDSGFSVQLGNGDGTFQAPVYYAAGVYPYNVFVGDFNGDGAPDLAIPSQTGITVELNTGGTYLSTSNAPNPSTLQQAVTLTTTVAASLKGSPAPAGSVTFKDGTTSLGTASVSNGEAVLTTSFSKPGTHTITAVYSGDSQFNPHTAASVTQTVLSPVVNLSPPSLNFGNQKVGTSSPPQTVKLTNRGQGTLNIFSIALLGNPDYNFTNNCGSSVGSNKSCTFTVTFTPQKKGTRSATISITDNAANSPQKIPLTGNGT